MDRELSDELRRTQWWRRHRGWIVAAAAIVALGVVGFRHLTPSLDRSRLSIAVVERGPIQAVISGTGTVVPIAQQTVSSPVSAEVRKVLVSLGEHVTEGQPLMELDRRAAELALNNLEEELALKRQELQSTDLQLADAITESRSKHDLLVIDLEAQDAKLHRLQQLGDSGIVSAQDLLEARLNVKRTRVEIEQIEAQLGNAQTRRTGELTRLRQSCVLLEKKVADQAQRVALTSVTAAPSWSIR